MSVTKIELIISGDDFRRRTKFMKRNLIVDVLDCNQEIVESYLDFNVRRGIVTFYFDNPTSIKSIRARLLKPPMSDIEFGVFVLDSDNKLLASYETQLDEGKIDDTFKLGICQ